jgi:hypothetical protein
LPGTGQARKAQTEGTAVELRQVSPVGRQRAGEEEGRWEPQGDDSVGQQVRHVHVSISRGMGRRGDPNRISRLSGKGGMSGQVDENACLHFLIAVMCLLLRSRELRMM